MAASSWGEFIARLPAEVRAMVDSLAEEEQEAFSYLASYSAFDHHHHHHHQHPGKGSKKYKSTKHLQQQQQQQQNPPRSTHERAFGCECLDCYLKYWHLWVSSPNTQVIDKALELLELSSTSTSSTSTSASRSSWKRSKQQKPKKSISSSRKPKDSPEVGCPEPSNNREDLECGEKKPSPSPQLPPAVGASKPRSNKQVAPLDFSFKEEELLEVVEDPGAPGASGDGGGGGEIEIVGNRGAPPAGKSQSFGSRASEALGFACEKLLWMWNPRFRRRQ